MKKSETLHCQWIATHDVAGQEEEWKRIYGDDVVISQVGRHRMIHLDRPRRADVERRHRSFDPGEIFREDCSLCQMLRRHANGFREG